MFFCNKVGDYVGNKVEDSDGNKVGYVCVFFFATVRDLVGTPIDTIVRESDGKKN